MEAGIFNNILSNLVMINSYSKAGELVSQAISEVKSSRRSMSMTDMLIKKGIVGSDSALS